MTRIDLGVVALLLVACGGSVVRVPEDGEPAGIAGARSAAAGASPAGGPAQKGGDGPSAPELGGASAGGASSASDAGTANGPEPEAGAGGDAAPGSEPVRTLIQAPAVPRGFVSALQYEPGDASAVSSLQADFGTSRGPWDGCTQIRLGECWYYDCPEGSQPFRIIGGATLQDAGDLSATASATPDAPLQLAPLLDHFYETDVAAALWPLEGGAVRFAASGAAVPAFSLDVATPPTVTLTSINGAPAPTTNTDENGDPLPFLIVRSEGLKLRWLSRGRGTATFFLWGFEGRRFATTCEFDASAEHGELPAALLQQLEPSPTYNMTFRGTSVAHAKVGDFELEGSLSAGGGPLSPFVRWPITLR